MKEKILIIFCIIVVSTIVASLAMTNGFKHTMTIGICLVTDTSVIVIVEDSPIDISNQSVNEDLFVSLQTGDKVVIVHGGVEDTYPAHTGVYKLLKIDTDCLNEVSPKIITELEEIRYVAKKQ